MVCARVQALKEQHEIAFGRGDGSLAESFLLALAHVVARRAELEVSSAGDGLSAAAVAGEGDDVVQARPVFTAVRRARGRASKTATGRVDNHVVDRHSGSRARPLQCSGQIVFPEVRVRILI